MYTYDTSRHQLDISLVPRSLAPTTLTLGGAWGCGYKDMCIYDTTGTKGTYLWQINTIPMAPESSTPVASLGNTNCLTGCKLSKVANSTGGCIKLADLEVYYI